MAPADMVFRSGTDAADPLRLSSHEFRRIAHEAADLAADYLESLAQRPVFRPMAEPERRALAAQPLPETGSTPDSILKFIHDNVLRHPMGNGHPRFFGWVNSAPAPIAVAAELLATAMSPSCAGGDHAPIYMERAVVRWLMELVGFPTEGSMGLLVSGGSMASLTCLAAARRWAGNRQSVDIRENGTSAVPAKPTLYISSEAHGCIRKAAHLLGLGDRAVRCVPVGSDFRMDIVALRAAIDADRESGLAPFCVVATAGTVNTGAIDPLAEIADVCREHSLWMHIDGAYGAAGVLDPALAGKLDAMRRADSLAIDPHKWLAVPVECGCAMVRYGGLLRATFSLVPPYLRTEEGKGFGGVPWYSEYGFQQSRGFRALKTWAVLKHAGREGLSGIVSRHNALAQRLAKRVDAERELERLAPVELSIVCFRYAPAALRGDADKLNTLNKSIMEAVQSGGEAFVSGTVLNGAFALRACVLNYATTEEDIEALVRVVLSTAERVRSCST
jgi:aromatic-L-amino-acid/L-tryptophan decarboxylase